MGSEWGVGRVKWFCLDCKTLVCMMQKAEGAYDHCKCGVSYYSRDRYGDEE